MDKFSRTANIRLIKASSIAVVVAIIVIYVILRSVTYFRGPAIYISQPSNGALISSTTTTVIGQVIRAHDLTMNGFPVTIDEQGNFRETIVVAPGSNALTFKANDQFGRSTQVIRIIVGSAEVY